MRVLKKFLCISSLLMACTLPIPSLWAQSLQVAQTNLPRIRLQLGQKTINVQVANTFDQRQIGLMYRKTMPANEGMLFVFEKDEVLCFWMKNTLLPLTAAFIDNEGRIINLRDMQPLSEENHCSSAPTRYVLEMHQGWFTKHGIKAGTQLRDAKGKPF